jgi:hypothetical protein
LDRGNVEQAPPQRLVRAEGARLPGGTAVAHVALTQAKLPDAKPADAAKRSTPGESAAAIEAPPAQRRDAVAPSVSNLSGAPERLAAEPAPQPVRSTSDGVSATLLEQIVPLPKMTDAEIGDSAIAEAGPLKAVRLKPVERVAAKIGADSAYTGGSDVAAGSTDKRSANGNGGQNGAALIASNVPKGGLSGTGRGTGGDSQQPVPDTYRLRVAPNRTGVAESHGGTAETEQAVKAALRWLADNQAADGRWDPRAHDAGKETKVLGQNRQGAGSRADTAMTGLALLAFLGSGHTHLEAPTATMCAAAWSS